MSAGLPATIAVKLVAGKKPRYIKYIQSKQQGYNQSQYT